MQEATQSSSQSPNSKRHLFSVAIVLAALIVGTIAVAPFFFSRSSGLRMLNTHDLGTLLAVMEEFDKGLRSGALYPRWLSDINYGYGAPIMVFYPPGLFYLSAFLNSALHNWAATTFVISALSLGASGIAMYALSRVFHGKAASIISALLYMLLPYHLLDLYWRGALPEFVGFVFLPAILYFFYQSGSQGRLSHYAGLGFFYGMYIMTHLPVSYIFTYALALYAVLWAFRSRDWKIVIRVACGMFLGLLLSAIYWLPAALEGKEIYEPVTELFPYHKTYFQTLRAGGSIFDVLVTTTFQLHLLSLGILIAVILISYFALRRSEHQESALTNHSQTTVWIVMAIVTTLMNTILSMPVSKLIPKIQIAVPAWRWMAVVSLFTALLAGAAFDLLSRDGLRVTFAWLGRAVILLVVGGNIWFTVQNVITPTLLHGDYQRPEEFASSGFIPKDAGQPQDLPKTAKVVVIDGLGEITRWDPMHREIDVTSKANTTLRLRTYNFPGWVASLDGGAVPIFSDSYGGQVINVPAGKHKVEVTFENTTPRNLGTVITALGFAGILGLSLFNRIKARRREEE
jgi:hypothetical protein